MNWLKKLLPSKIRTQSEQKKEVPDGIWVKCDACSSILYRAEVERNLYVCPKCDHHQRIGANLRLKQFLDSTTYAEIGAEIETVDRLKFKDSKKYKDRLSASKKASAQTEALIAVQGELCQQPIVVAVFDFNFMAGSMGTVVGERFVQAVHRCIEMRLPFVCFSTSGGARMQEGLFSLLQMGKVSAALAKLSAQKLPYISVLTDPTMGGVSASLAMLGDIIIAEPNALIGFAGPRVIEQTVREVLPEGFQRSEFLLEHGAIDMIIDRRQLRERIAGLVSKLMAHQRVA